MDPNFDPECYLDGSDATSSLTKVQCSVGTQPQLSTISLMRRLPLLGGREGRFGMLTTTVTTDESGAAEGAIRFTVMLQMTEEGEPVVPGKIGGETVEQVQEAGAGLAEADLGAGGEITLKQ
jgi:hypothetical protein